MIKIRRYTGEKVYQLPDCKLGTQEEILSQFPAALTFTHMVELDEGEQVCFAVQNLSAMRTVYGIDSSLSEDEALAAIEVIRNTPDPEPEASAEERIAAAMEFQNIMNL